MMVCLSFLIIYASHIILLLGKEKGKRMVLPDFLRLHSAVVRNEFRALSCNEKEALLRDHLQAKEEEMNVPKKTSNTALTKAVYSKMQVVTATVSVHPTFLTHF
jgi:hypothetical protein